MKSRALVLAIHLALFASSSSRAEAPDPHRDLVYTRADLEHSGFRTVADFLQRLPPFGSTLNSRYNGGYSQRF